MKDKIKKELDSFIKQRDKLNNEISKREESLFETEQEETEPKMMVYKYEVYVVDFEDYGSENYEILIDQTKGLDAIGVFKTGEIDIKEWDDDLDLNGGSREVFEKYFKKEWKISLPIDIVKETRKNIGHNKRGALHLF